MLASNELAELRAELIAICPDIEQDEALFADMLEGEAPDALAVIDRLIEAALESDAMARMIKSRQDDMTERRQRFERRDDAYRLAVLYVFERLNLKRLERPAWTASVVNRPPKVVITDEEALHDYFVRIKREPDKAAIATALKHGETVSGAELSNGGVSLTIRTK
ncbi:MAG: siphovirus Gp157 family protein [Terrimicrobiaceae bacterium]